MTGRAAGFCAGYPAPGYANYAGGRGFGGRGFRGGGWGRRNQFFATGVPGWARADYNWQAPGPGMTPQEELDGLKSQAKYLEEALNGISQRISELESK